MCGGSREIYAGTDDARMLRLSDAGGVLDPIQGFDRVAGRDTWFAWLAIANGQRVGPPLGIRSAAANADGSVLFANVHVGGIPRSVDGGGSSQPTIDIHTDVHEVRGHPANPDIVAAASGWWDFALAATREPRGLLNTRAYTHWHCSAVAFSGDDILVSAATDPFAAQGRVYRRPIRTDGALVAGRGWDATVDRG